MKAPRPCIGKGNYQSSRSIRRVVTIGVQQNPEMGDNTSRLYPREILGGYEIRLRSIAALKE
jgi:hypothetical protein